MTILSKQYPMDLGTGTIEQVNQSASKIDMELGAIYGHLNNIRTRYRSATAPTNPEAGQVWEDTVNNKIMKWTGSAWAQDIGVSINLTNRNTVLQGQVSSVGALELILGSTSALTADLVSSAIETIIAIPAGHDATAGNLDYIVSFTATQTDFWSSLPATNTSYLFVDYASGTVTGTYSVIAPVYQSYAPSHSAGKNWYDTNKEQWYVSDGSNWVAKYRVYVGSVVTDGTKVTATTIEPYNVIRSAVPMSYLDTDGTLAANSDSKIATQKAVKTYVDNNSGGSLYYGSGLDGAKTFATTTYLGQNKITNYAITSNVLTITTEKAHGLATNNWVSVAQCSLSAANTTQSIGTYGTTAGTHYRIVTGTPTANTFTVALTNADVASTAEANADATVCQWDGPTIVKNYSSLTIDSGVTITPAARCRGVLLFVTGNVNNAGTLTMTGRGASAAGADCSIYWGINAPGLNADYYSIPAIGANGGGATIGIQSGNNGIAGVNGQTGGGATGGDANSSYVVVAGGKGTSYSGGSASESRTSASSSSSVAASDTGGKGGDALGNGYQAGGGAGNPGGGGSSGGANGENGTGGLLVVICGGDFTNSGTISANGKNGGSATGTGSVGGGASGGGSINLFYAGTLSNTGTIQANGGTGGTGVDALGGNGGAGSIRTVKVAA